MSHVYVYKANAINDKMHILSKTIHIETELPSFDTIAESDAVLGLDADKIAEVLYNSLPGATFDRLLVNMLQQRSAHLHIPFGGML